MKNHLPILAATGQFMAGCFKEEAPLAPQSPSAETPAGPQAPSRAWTPEENAGFKSDQAGMGFDTSKVVDKGDYYLVESDAFMMKTDLGGGAALSKTGHYRSQYLVRDNKIHNLTVRVDPSPTSGNWDWRQGIQAAINSWNAMGYFVTFTYTTAATSDILVRRVTDGSNPGASSFPNSSGAPGQVSITLNAMRRLYSSHIKATLNVSLRLTGDANGDGKQELITFDEDGVVVSLANSSGTAFNNETLWNNQYGTVAAAGGWGGVENPRMLADVNGDGKIDVVGFGTAGVYVALSNGSSFVPVSRAATADFCYNQGWRRTPVMWWT